MPGVGDASVVAGSEIFQPYLLMVAEIVVVDYEGGKSAVWTKLAINVGEILAIEVGYQQLSFMHQYLNANRCQSSL
jgi:hypothetical protein